MENFLLILAVVGGVIYKIYENYKEEMEKARKRKTGMPTPYNQPPVQHHEETVYIPPQQEIVEMPEPLIIYDAPHGAQKKTAETSRKDIKKIRNKLDNIRVKETTQRAHEEASRRLEEDRKRRLALQGRADEIKPQLEVLDLDSFEFNLQDAVVQSAILERPYKD